MAEIYLKKPLDKKTKKLLIERFDSINESYDHKDPSHKDNVEIREDGTYCLSGGNAGEGNLSTHLYISKDGKKLDVDYRWNLWDVEQILKERNIPYDLDAITKINQEIDAEHNAEIRALGSKYKKTKRKS